MEKVMTKLKIVLLMLGVGVVCFLFFQNRAYIPELLQGVFEWVGRRGVVAPVYFIVIYILASFLLIPTFLLSVAGGFLFGVMPGAIVVTTAQLFSSALAYLASHYFLREWVHRQIEQNRLLQTADQIIKDANWKIVVLTRLAPIFPFTPLNLAYGVSKIKYWNFLLASFVGFLPGSFVNTYVGSVAGSLIGVQTHTRLPGEWWLLGMSVAAATCATFYMVKFTRTVFAGGAA